MRPDPRTVQALADWRRLRYGLFIHLGPNTLAGTGWGDGRFPAEQVIFPRLDCRQWAGVAAEAGMRYAVLTAKHHDGFCLWPSRHTPYGVAASAQGRDIVGEFVEACRAAGIRPGLYYSLWDRNCPCYADDGAYAAFMRAQLAELLTGYGDLVELWFDGGWDKDHPTRDWPFRTEWRDDPAAPIDGRRWEWPALYAEIKRHQPACLVLNNSSSDRPGVARGEPVDVLTREHPDFVFDDRLYEPPAHPDRPVETCTTITPDWFWRRPRTYVHPHAGTIAGWLRSSWTLGGNLLLNLGPDDQGLIPAVHRRFLREAAREAGMV